MVPGAASADREGCFCRGLLPLSVFFLAFFDSLLSIHYVCIQLLHQPSARLSEYTPSARLRPRPLRSTPPTPPLPPLRHAAPRAARPAALSSASPKRIRFGSPAARGALG
ncbi:hypothetical protein BJV77DRAFT_566216 [Russula vinacea]|nr:hypothetical protein BJV77DRAFT_566216 [Russula vinacea]